MKIKFPIFLYLIQIGIAVSAADYSDEFLASLDSSCISSRVPAPDIRNGYIIKYDRQRFQDNVYIIAAYACDEQFDFEENSGNKLYCSRGSWIGDLPTCKRVDEYNDYEVEEEEEGEEGPDDNYRHYKDNQSKPLTGNHGRKESDQGPTDCPADHHCDHNCVVVPSEDDSIKYNCTCHPGFSLSYDGRTCVDINECRETEIQSKCPKCENTIGSYVCFEKIPDVILNPCDNSSCINAECVPKSSQHYECVCADEFVRLDNMTCRPKDCRENECQRNSKCEEINGQFQCKNMNPCEVNNGGCSHLCEFRPTEETQICSCPNNQLILSDQRTCGCPAGSIIGDDGYCKPIISCEINNGGCEQICETNSGEAYCSCHKGFEKLNSTHCQDIDECKLPNKCEHECLNSIGSYECKCSDGFVLNYNNSTCLSTVEPCEIPKPPKYGNFECLKNNISSVECKIKCEQGYILQGSPSSTCSNGQWDHSEATCVWPTCPPMQKPEFGEVIPFECVSSGRKAGEKCTLSCLPGFLPVNETIATCTSNQIWSTSLLSCAKQQKSYEDDTYISCPQNTTIILRAEQSSVHVRLERPKTNSNKIRIHPVWAEQLNVELGPGVYVIHFDAYTDDDLEYVTCSTAITIKKPSPPQIRFCPESFEAHLSENENGKSVIWIEPIFEDESGINHIFRSRASGDYFLPGTHPILYEAVSNAGMSSICEFNINVRKLDSPSNWYEANTLRNHESFLICRGRAPIRVYNISVREIPYGCYIKNVRINPKLNFLRRNRFIGY